MFSSSSFPVPFPDKERLHSPWWRSASVALSLVSLIAGAGAGEAVVVENLGPQVFGSATHAAAFGVDADGQPVAYVLQDGALEGGSVSGAWHVIDVNRRSVQRTFPLPGSGGGGSVVVANDGRAYAGVYSGGQIFRYSPITSQLENLGRALQSESYLYGGDAGQDGEIYVGTFPGGRVVRYRPEIGFEAIGPGPFSSEEGYRPSYVRAVAYDPARQVVYAGTGPGPRLFRHDLRAGTTRQILPPQYQAEGDFLYGVRVIGDRILLKLVREKQGVVMRVDADGNAVVEGVFPMMSLAFTAASQGVVYYTDEGRVHGYNLALRQAFPVGESWPGNAYGIGLVKLEDQKNFPGETIAGICVRSGQIWLGLTCIKTGHTECSALPVVGVPQSIASIQAGPDGRIYSSGYLTGGTGCFDPSGELLEAPTRRGVAQVEGSTTLGGHIYFGGYPGGLFYDFDPALPWREGVNPSRRFELAEHGQDRPFGMAHDGDHRVFIGTSSDYGVLGGALTVFDTLSGQHTVYPAKDIGVPDLSIISCAWQQGRLYGGTTVSGGLGATPTQSEAKLLIFDPATGRGRGVSLPAKVTERKVITGVLAGPDGRVWMMAGGWLVVFDPVHDAFIDATELFPDIRYTPSAGRAVVRDATLHLTRAGEVYGTISGRRLFRLDAHTRAMTLITDTLGGTGLAEDEAGRLYFFHGMGLRRYTPRF